MALIRSSLVAVLLAASGCASEQYDPALAQRLIGSWRVNLQRTEPYLSKTLAEVAARKPEPSVEALRAQMVSFMQSRKLVFTSTNLEDWKGEDIQNGRYEILGGGENFLVIREFYDITPNYHDMTPQEIVDDLGLDEGTVPRCTGIEFLDKNHFRIFKYSVHDGQVTDDREYGDEVFERIDSDEAPSRP